MNVESYNISHFAFGFFLLGTMCSGFMHVMASVRISFLSKPNILLCVSTTCIPLLMNIYFTRVFNLQNIVLFGKHLMITVNRVLSLHRN